MGKSRRRNKREGKQWISVMSNATFYKMLMAIGIVIVICSLVIGVRTYQDKKQMAKQKEML